MKIRGYISVFIKSIRSEIGVTTIEPVDSVEEIEEVYKSLDESTQEIEGLSKEKIKPKLS